MIYFNTNLSHMLVEPGTADSPGRDLPSAVPGISVC